MGNRQRSLCSALEERLAFIDSSLELGSCGGRSGNDPDFGITAWLAVTHQQRQIQRLALVQARPYAINGSGKDQNRCCEQRHRVREPKSPIGLNLPPEVWRDQWRNDHADEHQSSRRSQTHFIMKGSYLKFPATSKTRVAPGSWAIRN